jgi:anti-anti-sigma factor
MKSLIGNRLGIYESQEAGTNRYAHAPRVPATAGGDLVETANVEVIRDNTKVTVIGTGALDLTNAQRFRDELLAAAESSDEVVVDLSGASFIDTAVLECLARAAKLLQQRQKRLTVNVREDTHPVHVLRVVGFGAVMDIVVAPTENQ